MKPRILIFVVAVISVPQNSYACSCDTLSFQDAVEWADEIFIGRIVKIEEVEQNRKNAERYSENEYWVTHFEISKKWKGDQKDRIQILQRYSSCELPFNFHDYEYLVYAKKSKKSGLSGIHNITHLCSRTVDSSVFLGWAEDSWDDRPLLDEMFPTPVQLSGFYISWKTWLPGILILSLILSYWIMRKKNKTILIKITNKA